MLSRSSVTKFTSVYFGGGESFQIGDWKPSDVAESECTTLQLLYHMKMITTHGNYNFIYISARVASFSFFFVSKITLTTGLALF